MNTNSKKPPPTPSLRHCRRLTLTAKRLPSPLPPGGAPAAEAMRLELRRGSLVLAVLALGFWLRGGERGFAAHSGLCAAPTPPVKRNEMTTTATATVSAPVMRAPTTNPAPLSPFHLAFPVDDLAQARAFYGQTLGCSEGRSSPDWIDFDLFGHQIVAHLTPQGERRYDNLEALSREAFGENLPLRALRSGPFPWPSAQSRPASRRLRHSAFR